MPNKHFCQGPDCHTRTTQDRFLKSRGVIRGRYASTPLDHQSEYYRRGKYFCSTGCESTWLEHHMESMNKVDRLSLSDTDERVGVIIR